MIESPSIKHRFQFSIYPIIASFCFVVISLATSITYLYSINDFISNVPGQSMADIVDAYNSTPHVLDGDIMPLEQFGDPTEVYLQNGVWYRSGQEDNLTILLVETKEGHRISEIEASTSTNTEATVKATIVLLMVLEENLSYEDAEGILLSMLENGEDYEGKYYTYDQNSLMETVLMSIDNAGVKSAIKDIQSNKPILAVVLVITALIAELAWIILSAKAHGLSPASQALLVVLGPIGAIILLIRLAAKPFATTLAEVEPSKQKLLLKFRFSSWCFGVALILLMANLVLSMITI